jgi:hypothetical protein
MHNRFWMEILKISKYHGALIANENVNNLKAVKYMTSEFTKFRFYLRALCAQ